MARRRAFGGRNFSTVPPVAIPVSAPTLDLAGLTSAYEWMSIDRLASLRMAHEWYAEAICPTDHRPSPLLYGAPLNPAQQKQYDMAVKIKGVGDSTPYPEEKATFLEKAIRMYEGIWASKNLPKVDEAASIPVGLGVKNVQAVLANFNAAFKSEGIGFRMTFNADREFLEGEILLPKKELDQLVGEPPLKAVLAEVPTVAKVASITTVDGQQQLDGAKFMATLPTVLQSVYNWAAGADRVMKPIGKAPVAVKPKAPKTPGASSTSTLAAPSVKYRPWMTIKVVGPMPSANGKRGLALSLVKDGMTIRTLQSALEAAGLKGYVGWVITKTVTDGAVTLL